MKKLLLFIAIAFVGMKGLAQVPTNGLVFRQDFTGNFNETSGSNTTSSANTATLTTDEFGTASNAGNFDLGQTLEYPFSTNAHLMVGQTIPYSTSISAKIYVDPTWLSGLASGQYITFLQNGNSYMRLLKTATNLYVQCGVYQGSAGYGGTQVISDEISSGWHTITMTFGSGFGSTAYVNIFKDGVSSGSISVPNWALGYAPATEKLVLGKAISANNNYKGKIDRVLIYNRELSAAEVLAIQNDKPSISLISSTAQSGTQTRVGCTINANASTTTALIRYGTTMGSLTLTQAGGGTATGTTGTPVYTTLSGLTIGTTYYYQVEATNANGTSISPIYSFKAGVVVRFPFDNNYSTADNAYTLLSTTTSPTFVANRFGEPNKAVYLYYSHLYGDIASLPTGNASRTVSFWAKRVTANMQHSIFAWGGTNAKGCFGGWIDSSNTYITNFWGTGNDYTYPNGTATTWDHYVVVYSSTGTISQYKNGVLQGTIGNTGLLSTSASTLHIGSYTNSAGAISDIYLDDFEVYNTALTATEVTALYNSQNLTTQSFAKNNLKASIYPNPASNNFTIEMENELKSATIYTLLGQKILTATDKNINITNLSKGTYLVQIEDTNNISSTQKLIVK